MWRCSDISSSRWLVGGWIGPLFRAKIQLRALPDFLMHHCPRVLGIWLSYFSANPGFQRYGYFREMSISQECRSVIDRLWPFFFIKSFFFVDSDKNIVTLYFIFTTCYAWVWHCHSERLRQKCCDNKSNFEAKFNFQIKLCDKRHNRLAVQIKGNSKRQWYHGCYYGCYALLKQNKPQS